jgi:hypothetical protein
MKWLAACAVLAIAGCASPGSRYQARLDGYVGKPEADLLQAMGRPQHTQSLADGGRMLEYSRERVVPYSGHLRAIRDGDTKAPPLVDYPSGTYNPAGLVPAQPASRDVASACALSFKVDAEGTVRSWAAEGEDCRLH